MIVLLQQKPKILVVVLIITACTIHGTHNNIMLDEWGIIGWGLKAQILKLACTDFKCILFRLTQSKDVMGKPNNLV